MLATNKALTIKQYERVVTTEHANEQQQILTTRQVIAQQQKQHRTQAMKHIRHTIAKHCKHIGKHKKTKLNRNALNAYYNKPKDSPKQ